MYVGLRDLKWARGRFALIVSTVLLITVLVGLLTGLTQGLGRQSTSAVTGLKTDQLVLGAATFDESRIRPDQLDASSVGIGITAMRATADDHTVSVAAVGVPAGTDVAPDARGIAPGKVVLTQDAADALENSSVQLGNSRFEVAATRGDASYSHMPVVWMDLADWQKLTGADGTVTALAVNGSVGELPTGWHASSPDDAVNAIPSYTSEHGSLLMIRGFLLAISALVIGAFFTVWTIQRSGDVAVLKALGASTASVLRDALGQAALVLAIGIVGGAAIALGVGLLATQVVPFHLDLASLLVPLGLLAILGLIGAGLAVRQVVKVDPLVALNGK